MPSKITFNTEIVIICTQTKPLYIYKAKIEIQSNKTHQDEKDFIICCYIVNQRNFVFFLRGKQKRNRLPDDGEYNSLKRI